jgi:hypothetical protein
MWYPYVTPSWYQRLKKRQQKTRKIGLSMVTPFWHRKTSAFADSTVSSYHTIHKQDCLAFALWETDGNSTINPIIVTTLMLLVKRGWPTMVNLFADPKQRKNNKTGGIITHTNHYIE